LSEIDRPIHTNDFTFFVTTYFTAEFFVKQPPKQDNVHGGAAIFGLFRGHQSRLKNWCFWIKKLNKYKLNILAFGKKYQFAIF
jgi:hypothetical protein